MSWKHFFSRSLAAAPDRLHMAAHSHHLWPDASFEGQQAAWDDAARLADHKWDKVMGEVWPQAQIHIANELRLPTHDSIVFAPNTHELLVRIISAIDRPRPRVLTSDGEFHSFRRQSARWAEGGAIDLETIAADDSAFTDRFLTRARSGDHDLIFVSHVMFGSGRVFEGIDQLAALARPEGPWIVIDGYHAFMAIDVDLSAVADRVFYLAGGYKYAMAGEGVCFLHAPPGYGERPLNTGWFAAFDDLALKPGQVGYARDARRFAGATFDPSGLYRFNAVQQMLKREGLTTARVNAHIDPLFAALAADLDETPLGSARLLNPGTLQPRARFVALESPRARRWQEALAAAHVVTDLRGDVLRIGLGLYHDEADIDRFCVIAATL
ncbi:MAG: aminotransferase class V-fold PLP-dependent enzyme [Hyphomonadaceae bacterium]